MRIIVPAIVLLISTTCCGESAEAQGHRNHRYTNNRAHTSQHAHASGEQRHVSRHYAEAEGRQAHRSVRQAAAFQEEFLPEPRSALTHSVPSPVADHSPRVAPSQLQWGDTFEEKRHIPFVNGDIFGVSRHECCDEWKGLFQCLELTNTRSRCECPGNYGTRFRATNSPGAEYFGSTTVQQYQFDAPSVHQRPQTARRTTVSEYFHPRR